MVIEWLQFRVDEAAIDEFVERDRAIWTTALAQYPGFAKKEVWTNPDTPGEIICVIHWETVEQWKSIPVSALESIEAEFQAEMGNRYELLEVRTYEQRADGIAP